jgi:hypothetical protein
LALDIGHGRVQAQETVNRMEMRERTSEFNIQSELLRTSGLRSCFKNTIPALGFQCLESGTGKNAYKYPIFALASMTPISSRCERQWYVFVSRPKYRCCKPAILNIDCKVQHMKSVKEFDVTGRISGVHRLCSSYTARIALSRSAHWVSYSVAANSQRDARIAVGTKC